MERANDTVNHLISRASRAREPNHRASHFQERTSDLSKLTFSFLVSIFVCHLAKVIYNSTCNMILPGGDRLQRKGLWP